MRQRFASSIFILFTVSLAAHAQNGCINSPENPTAVLGLLGVASAWMFQRRRR